MKPSIRVADKENRLSLLSVLYFEAWLPPLLLLLAPPPALTNKRPVALVGELLQARVEFTQTSKAGALSYSSKAAAAPSESCCLADKRPVALFWLGGGSQA